ncbi:WD40 repeat domain-containing protein [Streptomyces sp. AC563]|uniref:nSTAND1 domain-containing NTPase n=1 Tax=Streptomyces buecherae TaxID=2763006 RepID=UPI00164D20B1|nr:WD40 repeat domain-containing protein [Streptomyces buecherae]MBC3989652.1 WD40 repeat domain-containing protein [Streptomyces buecherae]
MGRREIPLDPGAGPVQGFAHALRELRRGAGNPTYRTMAQRAGYSVTALSQAAAGEKLPSLAVTLAYVRACAADPAEWEERWRRVDQAVPRPAEQGESVAPYRGLARFDVADADVFFGREALTERLADLVREHRFIAVFGPSGSGKSSLLRAGLVPRLRAGDDARRPVAAIRILTPGAHPLRTHAARLEAAEGTGDTWLLVDQFEELFTLCEDPAERSAFLDRLLAAREPRHRLGVVITVRADFLDPCTEHPGLTAAMQDATVLVGPMSDAELREAITRPARSRGLVVQRSLTDRILAEVQGEPGGLPLMSHALLETWLRRKGAALNEAAYEVAGGLRGAIARTAEDAYGRFTPAQADLARQILLRMVTPGRGTAATRRPIDWGELDFEAAEDATAVVERLAAARLLVIDGDTVELAHEALISSWPRLRRWVEAERDRLRLHRRLTDAARAWHDLDRDPGSLYRGSRLAAATEAFPAGGQRELTALEQSFLAASVRHRRRTQRLRRSAIAGLAALALVATGAAVVAVQQRGTARSERDTAVFHQITAEADALRGSRTSLAAQLDATAYRRRASDGLYTRLVTDAHGPLSAPLTGHRGFIPAVAFSADGRLLASASRDRTIRLWDVSGGRRGPVGRPLTAHGDEGPRALAFSPDHALLASAGHDGSVRLWDVSDPARAVPVGRPLRGHEDGVISLAFSPDGRTLASGSDDSTVRRWDLSRPERARPLGKPLVADGADGVRSVAFSPDGATLATAGFDETVRLWNMTDPARPTPRGRPLTGHQEPVWALAFSPDGRTLASAGYDRSVRLWNVTDPARPRPRGEPLTGHDDAVWSLAFSPDGHTLASAGLDDTVRLWYVKNPDYPRVLGRPLTDHTDGVWTVAFAPDGRTLASAGRDQTVRLWRLPDTLLTGHTQPVNTVAFHPRGGLLASAGTGGDIRLWDTSRPARPRRGADLVGHDGAVSSLAFSPDGRYLASAGEDETVRLWNVADPAHPRPLGEPLADHHAPVTGLAFRPDGRLLASAGGDDAIRLWSLADPRHPRRTGRPLTGHRDMPTSVTFSPDGHTLASGAEDSTARLWDVAEPGHPRPLGEPLADHDGFVTAVAFSPDGATLATGSADRRVRLWDVTDRRRPTPAGKPLTGHEETVHALAFRPDGRQLASAASDNAVRLWDTSRPAAARPVGDGITGHNDSVTSLAYHPSGTALATGSYDATTRVWLLPVAHALARTCAASGATLTRAAWRRHVHHLPYDPPCR